MKKLLPIAFSLCISIAFMPNIGLSMKLTEIKNISDMDIPKVDTSKWITYPRWSLPYKIASIGTN